MNISIPTDLKQRMDAVEEPTNWSAIASDAFRSHLHKIAAKKESIPMQEIIDRLKASQERSAAKFLTAGEKAGRDWAARRAETIQLQRLEEGRPDRGWGLEETTVFSDAELFFFTIDPSSDGDRGAAAEFWETVTGGPEAPEDAYVQGFESGAMHVWDQVKDQL